MLTTASKPRVRLCVGLVLVAVAATATAARAAGRTVEAKEVSAQLAADKGICVVLGLPQDDQPGFVTGLAAGNELLVYFQSPSDRQVLAVRKAAETAGLLGKRIFVDRGAWRQIHLASNLADAIWVAPAAEEQVAQQELLRVLRPAAKAIVGGREIVKPVPAGIDAWSHPYHGPDNNPQTKDRITTAPYLTQFLAEPKFSPMPEVTVAAGGRVFKACGHIAHKANQNPMLNTLLGINGYNGTILWKRPLREGFMIHRNTLIATPDTLYLADDESCKLIDVRDGRIKDQIVVPPGIGDGKVWKWMALEDSAAGKAVLYALVGGEEVQPKTVPSQTAGIGHWPWSMWEGHDYKDPKSNFGYGRTLVAFDPQSKRMVWNHTDQEFVDSRGVCMKDGRIYFYSPQRFLGCLDANTGKVLWRNSDADLLAAIGPTGQAQNPREGYATTTFIKCDGKYVYFAGPQRPNLAIASAADGKLLVQKQGGNLQLVLRDDAVYAVGPGGGKLAYGTWETLAALPNRRSCTRATGSVDCVFYRAAEGTMQIHTADAAAWHIAPMRPPCQDGVVIANGMLYWGPWMCGCPLSFYGHVAVSSAGDFHDRPATDDSRLEPGDGDTTLVQPLALQAGDWPCCQGDNQRTSFSPIAIPKKIDRHWTFQPPTAHRLTAPVTAGDLVFVGDDAGVLRALDSASGKPRWQNYLAGAMFAAPAVWEGRIYAGAGDGRVYAFEAATGRRLWTFRAAPAERWIPVFGKLLSTWPVAGGVVVDRGVLYTAAGIAHYDGTHVYALDATTGKIKWHNNSSGALSKQVRNGISLQGELSLREGALCFPGGSVYQTARYDVKTGACLNEPIHEVRSQYATAFYPYYPEYGQFASLSYALADGRSLRYEALYEGSRHTTLALFRPGASEPPLHWRPDFAKAQRSPRTVLWEYKPARKFNSFVVTPDTLLAASQTANEFFLTAIDLQKGTDIWQQTLPAAVVRGGTAVNHQQRIFAALEDGRLGCFGPAR